ncbi:Uma2 family endonuclease [Actinacidiphila glaucinigra]|uniref:Uma2 family endonuclease n=1 Tax=Actinacidiphila glaucinigra TaxID=235986 RepID=UPI0033F79263
MDARTYARMRAIADELMEREDTWAVEIGEGVITMMMSPVNRHELIALRLRRQIERQMAGDPEWAGHVAHSGPEIEAPAIGRMRRPDLIVVAEQALDTPGLLDPADVALVAEVVATSNPENDYREKTRDYPAMGIPLYLIIDPRDKTSPSSPIRDRRRATPDRVTGPATTTPSGTPSPWGRGSSTAGSSPPTTVPDRPRVKGRARRGRRCPLPPRRRGPRRRGPHGR